MGMAGKIISYLFSGTVGLSFTLALNTGILVSTTLFFLQTFSTKLAKSFSFLQLGVGEDLDGVGFFGVRFKNVNLGNFDLNGFIFFVCDDIFILFR